MRKEYDFRALNVKRCGPVKELHNAARSDKRAPKRTLPKLDRKVGLPRAPRAANALKAIGGKRLTYRSPDEA